MMQSQALFRVVTSGRVLQGMDRQQVIHALAQTFKIDEGRAAAYLGGRFLVLRSNLDHASAQQWVQSLQRIGIECAAQPMPAASPAPPVAAPAAAGHPAPGPAGPPAPSPAAAAHAAPQPAHAAAAQPAPSSQGAVDWACILAQYQFMLEDDTAELRVRLAPQIRAADLASFPARLRAETPLLLYRTARKKEHSELLITDGSFALTGGKAQPITLPLTGIRSVEITEKPAFLGMVKDPLLKINGKEVAAVWINIYHHKSIGLLLGTVLDHSPACAPVQHTQGGDSVDDIKIRVRPGAPAEPVGADALTLYGRFLTQPKEKFGGAMAVLPLLGEKERREVLEDASDIFTARETPVFAKAGIFKLVVTTRNLYYVGVTKLKDVIPIAGINAIEEHEVNDVRINNLKLEVIFPTPAHSRAFAMMLARFVQESRPEHPPRLVLGGKECSLDYTRGLKVTSLGP